MIATDLTNSNRVPTRFALSIVIPVYNGASSIADLVTALEDLTIAGGHELILVNDGSPVIALQSVTRFSTRRVCPLHSSILRATTVSTMR
jgi:glycosyl transferase family 2